MNNAALTAPSNLNGSPAMSIPRALSMACPLGCRSWPATTGSRCLLDLALVAEREFPWPKVAPGSPHERPAP